MRGTMLNLKNDQLPSILIKHYITALTEVLSTDVISIYIHGSIATGHYNPKTSDIDMVVVLNPLNKQTLFKKLNVLHNGLKHFKNGHLLEVSYLTKKTFEDNHLPSEPKLYVNNNRLMWADYGAEWYFERHTLLSQGILAYGEELRENIEPVERTVLNEAVLMLLNEQWRPLLEENNLSDDYMIYGLHTLCRMLFTYVTGITTDKVSAVQWVGDRYFEAHTIKLLNSFSKKHLSIKDRIFYLDIMNDISHIIGG